MRKIAFGLLLVGLTAGMVFAQSASVQYLEGTCELQSGKDWKKLSFGAKLDDKAVVRLAAQSMLVIDRSDASVSLTKAGTYVIGDLLTASKKASSNNLASIIGKKVENATSGNKTTSTVGGVRADAKDGTNSPTSWSEGDPNKNLEDARQALSKKDLAKAKAAFDEAVANALQKERDSVVVRIGELSLASGYPSLANSYLTKMPVASKSEKYSDFVLIKARVLFESLNFEDAKAYCDSTIKTVAAGKAKQGLLIIQALSERSLGHESNAVALFELAIKENPATDEAQLATKLKKSA